MLNLSQSLKNPNSFFSIPASESDLEVRRSAYPVAHRPWLPADVAAAAAVTTPPDDASGDGATTSTATCRRDARGGCATA